jgi:hypothetical protein
MKWNAYLHIGYFNPNVIMFIALVSELVSLYLTYAFPPYDRLAY